MFVYERNGSICVTFIDNKPVADPEYVITVDEEAKTIAIEGAESTETSTDTSALEKQIADLTADNTAKDARIAELEAELEELKSAE